jgi:hypothetical protein
VLLLTQSTSLLQEYILGGHISRKLDAFAFGICLVEILTELKPGRARELVDEHTGEELVSRRYCQLYLYWARVGE